MFIYPIEKYKFYVSHNKVIAITTYAGRTVRGVAKCHPEDMFDLEVGKKIAAARCAKKVAKKRLKRADEMYKNAEMDYFLAADHLHDMNHYFEAAHDALEIANKTLDELVGYF